MASFFGSGNIFDKIGQLFDDPRAAWDEFTTGGANALNAEIANENLAYQRERNQIEDSRYGEERAYNRAFAEENRAYERALQQQIFDREDTALERQASSLSKMGINPLAHQLNGLGSGAVVAQSSSTPSVAPSMSNRGGQALNNDFKMQSQSMLPILSSLFSVADTINGVKTGEYQRDALALQNDKQFLENLKVANGLGIRYGGLLPAYTDSKGYIDQAKKGNATKVTMDDGQDLFATNLFKSASSSEWRKMRKDSMPDWQYTLDSFGNDDIYTQAENALTKVSKLFDKVFSNIMDKANYSKNPFQSILNLFF